MEGRDGDRRSRPMMYNGVPIVNGDDLMAIEAAKASAIAAAAAAGRPRQTTKMSPAAAQIRKQRPFLTPLYQSYYIPPPDRRESKGENLDPSTATAVHPRPATNNIIKSIRKPLVITLGPKRRAYFARESKPRGESIGENLNPSSAAAATAIGSNVEVMRHSLLNMDLGKSTEEAAI